MIRETDFPCSDCGADLFERSVDVRNLLVPVSESEMVTIAECRQCGAQYYPEETLTKLAESVDETRSGQRGEG